MGGGALHTQREAPGFSPCGEGEALAAHAFVFERGELYTAGHAAGAEWAQDITGVAVNPKGAKRCRTKRSAAQRLRHFMATARYVKCEALPPQRLPGCARLDAGRNLSRGPRAQRAGFDDRL